MTRACRVVTCVLALLLAAAAPAAAASIHSLRPRNVQVLAASTPRSALAAWNAHSRQQQQQQPVEGRTSIHRNCAPGCEANGNCNRALGTCECPVGYIGVTCSEPLWPSCKASPRQQELYCSSDWRPKSCACLEQCAAFVCPDNTHASCERDFDLHNAMCFQREGNASRLAADGVAWDGGSDLPDDMEEGVKYYKGWLHKDIKHEIKREQLTEVGIIEDIDPASPLVALPLSSCPLNCSYNGGCVRRKDEALPFCACHYGFTGEFCEERAARTDLQNVCWNNCQGRGTCRRGFCHCQPGFWGKDCSSSKLFAPRSSRRPVHKLRVYVYDLPWQVAYQPEYNLGFRDHDQNYMAWKVFGQMFMNDTVTRTQNPWEANLFYIPAMTYAFSENTGNSVLHSRRVINYVRQQWPFFNRSQGLDHFLWLTGDRGACDWPAEDKPELANIIKVVHFGWHHVGAGHVEGKVTNKHWHCFNPLRDIVAAAYWADQAEVANKTFLQGAFDAKFLPKDKLLFFSGSIRTKDPEYSQGVRQQLWQLFGDGRDPRVLIHEGGMPPEQYSHHLHNSRFCLAPSGYGWGIRLNQVIAAGCVPVIVQDDIYQPWEDQLPYSDFSVRLPKSSIPDIVGLLSEISDEEYLQLRAGLLKHWRAFVWDTSIGGQAYDYMVRSLKDRMLRLQARHYHPLHFRPQKQRASAGAQPPASPAAAAPAAPDGAAPAQAQKGELAPNATHEGQGSNAAASNMNPLVT